MTFIKIPPVITVDGPSGVGKGTLCKELMHKFHWNILDSGKIYRTLAMIAISNKISINSEKSLISLAMNLNMQSLIEKDNIELFLINKEVNKLIKNEKLGNIASKIATFSKVREVLLDCQRSFRKIPGLIADGRDMGTVIFPDAQVKIFLDASLEERTRRRMQQLHKYGIYVNFKSLLYKIKERDIRDKNRFISPMIPAIDALVIDSTKLSIKEMIDKALSYIKKILK